ncbi:MAG TPA: GFA family protein [Ramlibacter sp.]|nr:GFA family protein [Ramlibacter sp.]
MSNPQPAAASGLTGGCLCGAVRYEARGAPFHRTVCHCSICRRSTGAPMVAWFSVKLADFTITAGLPRHYRSSNQAVRSCCPACGTQLTFKYDGLQEIDVTVGSLDDPAAVPPEDHTYVSSQLPWVRLADGLPRHLQARQGPG